MENIAEFGIFLGGVGVFLLSLAGVLGRFGVAERQVVKNPNGHDRADGTGVACPIGVDVQAN